MEAPRQRGVMGKAPCTSSLQWARSTAAVCMTGATAATCHPSKPSTLACSEATSATSLQTLATVTLWRFELCSGTGGDMRAFVRVRPVHPWCATSRCRPCVEASACCVRAQWNADACVVRSCYIDAAIHGCHTNRHNSCISSTTPPPAAAETTGSHAGAHASYLPRHSHASWRHERWRLPAPGQTQQPAATVVPRQGPSSTMREPRATHPQLGGWRAS